MNYLVRLFLLCILLLQCRGLSAKVYPLQFGIPECKMISGIPEKTRDFASLIPGDLSTYIYSDESSYYQGYQCSYFAYTWKKGGWDCMRHYEILANGCIPYFVDLEKSDPHTMLFLPKELILEAMHLPGVHKGSIDHNVFDKAKYYEILEKLLAYTRQHLTTKCLAAYILETINYKGSGNLLYLSEDVNPDYMRCLMLTGLKELLGERVVDFPKIPHIYKSCPDVSQLYGKGFTYSKTLEDLPIDRENIEERIQNREFDLIIYGSVHRGLPYLSLVKSTYTPDEVIYLCGEDSHKCLYSKTVPHLFLREFESLVSKWNQLRFNTVNP